MQSKLLVIAIVIGIDRVSDNKQVVLLLKLALFIFALNKTTRILMLLLAFQNNKIHRNQLYNLLSWTKSTFS